MRRASILLSILFLLVWATSAAWPQSQIQWKYKIAKFNDPRTGANSDQRHLTAPEASEYVLYGFGGGADGDHPLGALVFDAAGNLYGTTYRGGNLNFCSGYGCGTVFKLTPNADGSWVESVLYAFTGADGAYPYAGLTWDLEGNLYGTTDGGGNLGGGTVFKLDSNGNETVLHNFSGGTDGAGPNAGLVRDEAGNLYGTTFLGGIGYGVVFTLAPATDGSWTQSVIHLFRGSEGANPGRGNLVLDAERNLYGTTEDGGEFGNGVVYSMRPLAGGRWRYRVLHHFGTGSGEPVGGLVFDAAGNLYGTTSEGAAYGAGAVFRLAPRTAGGWTYSTLYAFQGGADGAIPEASLVVDAQGNLYGTTIEGGVGLGGGGLGTVFKMVRNAKGKWTESVLFGFGAVGCQPVAPLIVDTQGNLYGTSSYCSDGSVFEILQ